MILLAVGEKKEERENEREINGKEVRLSRCSSVGPMIVPHGRQERHYSLVQNGTARTVPFIESEAFF